jgi:CheY-like chemotaxis protein
MTSSAHVLVLEDEWLIAEDHALSLRRAGHHVVGPCATVEQALQAIAEKRVDVALLDIELRNERSYEVALQLQRMHIPFAFLSGHNGKDLPVALRDEQVLGKPMEPASLLRAIDHLIGQI